MAPVGRAAIRHVRRARRGAEVVWPRVRRSDRVNERQAARALCYADVAQLVAHHLAKVRVAGSNPVVRSRHSPSAPERRAGVARRSPDCTAAWPSGLGKGLQSPVRGFDSRRRLALITTTAIAVHIARAISSVGERFPDTEEATGSIPVSPTQCGRLPAPARKSESRRQRTITHPTQ